jgi:hypothetical protein
MDWPTSASVHEYANRAPIWHLVVRAGLVREGADTVFAYTGSQKAAEAPQPCTMLK